MKKKQKELILKNQIVNDRFESFYKKTKSKKNLTKRKT